jgi:hypothetical protein
MNWSILLNPFNKFSEKQLLFFGLVTVAIGSYIAYLVGVTFDGAIDVHLWPNISLFQSLKENVITILLLTILLFALGKIINAKTRLIDILNASLIFRVPFYLTAVLVGIPAIKEIEDSLVKNAQNMADFNLKTTDIIILLCLTAALIALLIYAIALLYNGFKTATNVKQTSHKVFFGIAILVAEILCKIFLTFL